MIYLLHETARLSTRPLATWLDLGNRMARSHHNPWRDSLAMRAVATMFELPHRQLKGYAKPKYEVRHHLGDLELLLEPELVSSQPFAELLRFSAPHGEAKKKVLIAAALSGHYSTLLQGTIAAFAQDFDTHITDWKNARDVPISEGGFGFDDYVDHLINFVETMGPNVNLVATCQAAPPAMVAMALLAKRNPDLVPSTITLMGGPIDTRINPGRINKFSDKLPLKVFELCNIHKVPPGYLGGGRRVYPGFYQLSGFIALNPKPHLKQYAAFAKNSVNGDEEATFRFRKFYDEYFSVLDMTEEFYIESLRKVFMEHHIPRGVMEYRGARVDFSAIKDVGLLTVEGENDHLCPPGQTKAAHSVFSGIGPRLKKNHVQKGVGHYGVFSGSKFDQEIYPVVRDHIMSRTD